MPEPVSYVYHQSIVQYRVPMYPDGTFGSPEILKKFVSDIKGTQKQTVRKQPPKPLETEEIQEEYL